MLEVFMISRAVALIICTIGVLLPWRARIIFSDLLGWTVQFIYFLYYGTLNFLLKELKKDNVSSKDEVTHE